MEYVFITEIWYRDHLSLNPDVWEMMDRRCALNKNQYHSLKGRAVENEVRVTVRWIPLTSDHWMSFESSGN